MKEPLVRAARFAAIAAAACLVALAVAPNSSPLASECPLVPGMRQAECKEFAPSPRRTDVQETWWYDTDGIDPGTAGCHIEVKSSSAKPNDRSAWTGRSFGEICLGNILVETNPAANVVHRHSGDIGNPNYVNCNTWCVESQRRSSGKCTTVRPSAKDALVDPCETSAKCVCN